MADAWEQSFSVVSLNLARESSSDRVLKAIGKAPRLHEADLFLFQEVRHEEGRLSVAEQVARELNYQVLFAPEGVEVFDRGLALISRFPLTEAEITPLKACDLRFRSRKRFAMAAVMRTHWGEMRVWNLHLDTRINRQERIDQIQPVINAAAMQSGPRVIGGDFNTNELYWLGNVVPLPFGGAHGAGIRAAMEQRGFETPFSDGLNTFRPLRRHLDWIYSSELQPIEAGVEPVAFSDHNAVWVRVARQRPAPTGRD